MSFTARPMKGRNINRMDNEANQGQGQGDNQNQGQGGYLVVVGGRRGRYYPGPPAAGG